MSRPAPPMQHHPHDIDGVHRFVDLVFGPDRQTRSRTGAIMLCALMYLLCCAAAFYGADLHIIKPFAPRVLLALSVPAYVVFFALVRSGRTLRLKDPALMLPQNVFALLCIAFAYTAVGPNDRGLVLVLIALVMVFGMYTHTPSQSVAIGLLALVLLGASMGVLSYLDPHYYPPEFELLRFELLLGTVPALIYSAHQISTWRNRLAGQRRELRAALDKVQELATRDPLTGLYNRRHMQSKLEESIKRFDRYGERFTVVLADLDHFKQINDQFGHKAGDLALMAFANAATMVLRDTDTVARWGGEEFLFLMPNTTPGKALIALNRLRVALDACTVSPDLPRMNVHFSSGLAVHDQVEALNHTLERADRALYQAKDAGRGLDVVAPAGKH